MSFFSYPFNKCSAFTGFENVRLSPFHIQEKRGKNEKNKRKNGSKVESDPPEKRNSFFLPFWII